jgi:hypothetical protein
MKSRRRVNSTVRHFFMNSRILLLTRVLQLIGGVLVLFFGYGIWLQVWLWSVSLGPTIERTDERSTNAVVFSMLVLPGLMVAIGSYLETIYYKTWALLLVGIGSVAAASFVGLNAFFLYAYVGSKWGVRAVITDLFSIALTFGFGITNAIVLKRPMAKPIS